MRYLRYAVVACVIGLPIGCGFSLGEYGTESDSIHLPDRPLEDVPEVDALAPVSPSMRPAPLADAGPSDAAVDARRLGPFKAFVSSTLVKGNAIGGLAGADALCNAAAKAAGLPGTYTAWLSTSTSNAIDRIQVDGPWQLVNGTTLAATKADLTKGSLAERFDKTEKGTTPPAAEDRVWTATNGNGTFAGPDCNGWTGGNNGTVGEAEQKSAQWTNLVAEGCGEVNRVYCLGQ
jgi:hypothetical protein